MSVFEQLKRGERFAARDLLPEYQSLELFWKWWWSQTRDGELRRPMTVVDTDPLLIPTVNKTTIDVKTHAGLFTDYLLNALSGGYLPAGDNQDRAVYRDHLLRHFYRHATQLPTPTLVFSGGGYGSGKTTTLDLLVKGGLFPIPRCSVMGVDRFKMYLPEFSILGRLCDGRGSSVVQDEGRKLADEIFNRFTEQRLSFGWDSSMSDQDKTMALIRRARECGYRLLLVAVFCPLETAICWAMNRARTPPRRFPHPEFLPKSHQGFREYFRSYLPHFDEVQVFANEGSHDPTHGRQEPVLIATQKGPNTALTVLDHARFERLV